VVKRFNYVQLLLFEVSIDTFEYNKQTTIGVFQHHTFINKKKKTFKTRFASFFFFKFVFCRIQ